MIAGTSGERGMSGGGIDFFLFALSDRPDGGGDGVLVCLIIVIIDGLFVFNLGG